MYKNNVIKIKKHYICLAQFLNFQYSGNFELFLISLAFESLYKLRENSKILQNLQIMHLILINFQK